MTIMEQMIVLSLMWAVWLWIVFKPRGRKSIRSGVRQLNQRIERLRNRAKSE